MDVWGVYAIRLQKTSVQNCSLMDVMDNMSRRCSREELNLFAVIAKKI